MIIIIHHFYVSTFLSKQEIILRFFQVWSKARPIPSVGLLVLLDNDNEPCLFQNTTPFFFEHDS